MYRNDRTERYRLYRLWIEQEDRPCAKCGGRLDREIGHIIPYLQLPVTDEAHCQVECRQCNRHSKFRVGDRVKVNGRTPNNVDLERGRPRTIVAIRYSPARRCNYYTLGSNGRGATADGQPLEGYRLYDFRSYMLVAYQPRQYGRRRYTMSPDDSRLTSKSSPIN